MLEQNSVLNERYRIERLLGQGGMGAVYQATDLRFGSTVALKETLVSGDVLQRAFEREARLLNRLRHAALPVVIDYFYEGRTQFLVMQFIPGEDFFSLLASRGALPVEDVLDWAETLLDALDFLHTQDPPVVHRDIKPQNLKLTPRGEIILLDFGLAKGLVEHTGLPPTGSLHGYTPHYAPFEQIQGAGTDPRSDLYALAATIHHLLTNAAPADAMSRADAAIRHEPDPLVRVDTLNPQVPAAVADVILCAMALKREERYASANQMRAALRAARNQAVLTLPAGSGAARPAHGSAPHGVTETVAAGVTVSSRDSADATAIQETLATRAMVDGGRRWRWIAPGLAALALVVGAWFLLPRLLTSKPVESAKSAGASAVPGGAVEVGPFVNTTPPLVTVGFETVALTPTGRVAERRRLTTRVFFQDVNGVTVALVEVPGGTFSMGSPPGETDRYKDEGPTHDVTIAPYFIGQYEVTQAQWRAVAALPRVSRDLVPDPSEFKGDNLPVEHVSWDDAVEFCARLSNFAKRSFRLPSESEWEYACRAGSSTPFAFGDTVTAELANFDCSMPYGSGPTGVPRRSTLPVGSLGVANNFGIFDMHGNVWEWCLGVYHESYDGAPADGSPWLAGGDARFRICRGGSWVRLPVDLRSAERYAAAPDASEHNIGFRIAMRVDGP